MKQVNPHLSSYILTNFQNNTWQNKVSGLVNSTEWQRQTGNGYFWSTYVLGFSRVLGISPPLHKIEAPTPTLHYIASPFPCNTAVRAELCFRAGRSLFLSNTTKYSFVRNSPKFFSILRKVPYVLGSITGVVSKKQTQDPTKVNK